MSWLLPAIVFAPLLGGVVTLLWPERSAKWVAAFFSLIVFLASLWLYFGLVFKGSPFGDVMNPAWAFDAPWINANIGGFHFQIDFAFGTDGLSMPMIILNGLLTF